MIVRAEAGRNIKSAAVNEVRSRKYEVRKICSMPCSSPEASGLLPISESGSPEALRLSPGKHHESMKIYFAGPLFSEAEKRFNLALTGRLESAGFEVFLPQRDGVEKDKPPYNVMEPDERRRAMFELDRD